MPKVSVIMGVYNNAGTLRESIDSVLRQTFDDFEFIIYDDASTDASLEILRRAAKADKRITVLHGEENRGLSYALNRCIDASSGEYCARMDGDDLCDGSRFEKQTAFLDSHHEYGFVSTLMNRFDEKGVYSTPPNVPGHSPSAGELVPGSPFCHATVMIRRSAYITVGGYSEDRRCLGVEDYDLWFRLYAAGIRGYIMGEALYSMFDGRDAARRRTMKRRVNEAGVRRRGYRLLHVPIIRRVYVLKPIVIGLIPQWLYRRLRGIGGGAR